jgi:hypothetical protein
VRAVDVEGGLQSRFSAFTTSHWQYRPSNACHFIFIERRLLPTYTSHGRLLNSGLDCEEELAAIFMRAGVNLVRLLDPFISDDGIRDHRHEDQRTSTPIQASSDSLSPSEGTTSNSDS